VDAAEPNGHRSCCLGIDVRKMDKIGERDDKLGFGKHAYIDTRHLLNTRGYENDVSVKPK
jgi:hypothetical protein